MYDLGFPDFTCGMIRELADEACCYIRARQHDRHSILRLEGGEGGTRRGFGSYPNFPRRAGVKQVDLSGAFLASVDPPFLGLAHIS